MEEPIRYAIDMKSTVILIGYPDLDMPFEYYGRGTDTKTYHSFMRKHSYFLKSNGTYAIQGNQSADGYDERKRELYRKMHEDLDALIIHEARTLIEAHNDGKEI